MKLNKKKSAGFTLVELLVAITIFSLLSGFVVASYKGNDRLRQLKVEAQALVSALETAQNKALTGETIGDGKMPESYEVIINNCNANCEYETKAVMSQGSIPLVSSKIEAGLKAVGASPLIIDFSLFRGKMNLIDGAGNSLDSAEIETSNGADAFCITLNSISGRIDISAGACQ